MWQATAWLHGNWKLNSVILILSQWMEGSYQGHIINIRIPTPSPTKSLLVSSLGSFKWGMSIHLEAENSSLGKKKNQYSLWAFNQSSLKDPFKSKHKVKPSLEIYNWMLVLGGKCMFYFWKNIPLEQFFEINRSKIACVGREGDQYRLTSWEGSCLREELRMA